MNKQCFCPKLYFSNPYIFATLFRRVLFGLWLKLSSFIENNLKICIFCKHVSIYCLPSFPTFFYLCNFGRNMQINLITILIMLILCKQSKLKRLWRGLPWISSFYIFVLSSTDLYPSSSPINPFTTSALVLFYHLYASCIIGN